MIHQEIGWPRGVFVARERIPQQFVALVENGEITEEGAIRSRRGAAVAADIAGVDLRHGDRFIARSGLKSTIVIDSGGVVRDVTGAPVVLGNVSASMLYSSDQANDRMYVATGSQPSVIYEQGGELRVGFTGLPKPPAPVVEIGNAGAADPSDPGIDLEYLTVHPNVGAGGAIYGASAVGLAMRRYDIATDAWTDAVASRLTAMTDHMVFARTGGDMLINAPRCATGHEFGAANQETRYYNPVTNLWSGDKPLRLTGHSVFWARGSSFATSPPAWGGNDFAIVYYYGPISFHGRSCGYALARVSESGSETSVVLHRDLVAGRVAVGAESAYWNDVTASAIVPVNAAGVVYVMIARASGVTECFRINTTDGTMTLLPSPGFQLSQRDRAVYPGTSQYFYVYRAGTREIWRYDTSIDVWAQIQGGGAGAPESIFHPGIVGGQPVNQNVYYMNAGFRSVVVPDATIPKGTIKLQITWKNDFTQSPPSDLVTLADVPDGATLTIHYPQPPPATADTVRVFRTIKNGETLLLRREDLIETLSETDQAVDAGFLSGETPPGPTGIGAGGVLPDGAKIVVFHDGSTWWLNLGDGASDAMWSRRNAMEIFSSTWRTSFQANDGDEITGAASLPPGLLVLKRRSVFIYVGDPGEPPDVPGSGFQRRIAAGIGCAAPRSVARLGRYAYFVGEEEKGPQRGVWRTDGVSAPTFLSAPIQEAVPANLEGAVAFAADNRYYVSFDGLAFWVYDATAGRWEGRLTMEAHRNAPIAAAFVAADLGQRIALAGSRAIRFAEDGLAVSPLDPFRLRIGPLPRPFFESDTKVLRVWVRYAGDVGLYWKTDVAGEFHTPGAPSAIEIALGAQADTATVMRKLPTLVYGRRIFLELAASAAAPVLVDGVTYDLVPMGRRVGAA